MLAGDALEPILHQAIRKHYANFFTLVSQCLVRTRPKKWKLTP